jgi:flagellar protein FlgJ
MANVVPTNAVDLEGLNALKRRAQRDDAGALAEVAVQFEALFIGMMLDSARSASLGNGVFDGNETEQYLSLMDRQVALELARSGGFGFAKTLTEQLSQRIGAASDAAESGATRARAPVAEFPRSLPATLTPLGAAAPATQAPTPAQFVAELWPEAKAAGTALGVEPRLLLAQAALETGWGKAVPQHEGGDSAHNLFGIKAGSSWSGERVERWTLEHIDGAATAQREPFRAYGSTAESFGDYVSLIGTARRYADALSSAGDPEAYARAVQKAGYATDPKYADKWLAIYHGDRLEQALESVEPRADQ